MKTLNIHFEIRYYSFIVETENDSETTICITDNLYEKLKKIYSKTGKECLVEILETEEFNKDMFTELNGKITDMRADLIQELKSYKEYCPEYSLDEEFVCSIYSNLQTKMFIVIPDDWDVPCL